LDSRSSRLLEPIALGATSHASRLFLAPMAGYTDAPFRALCCEQGAALCYAEMVSAEAVHRGSDRTLRLLDRFPGERHVGHQIFASSPAAAASAVRAIHRLAPTVIDLNCGCSVPKVLKSGCGAALLRDPALVGRLVRAMRGETDLPVTIKLRLGWDERSISFIDCAGEAVRAGAAAVTLHPRTRSQGFGGRARWPALTELRAAVSVPVFGSGDLFAASDALAMAGETGVDAVMIARGSLGNPFVFAEIRARIEGRDLRVGARERLETALRHLAMEAEAKGEPAACREMRKHFVAYSKGMEGGAALRQAIVHAATIERYRELVEEFLRASDGTH
jgi:tRNA-dihydrouridine synthase B